jgi:hypothetical protein
LIGTFAAARKLFATFTGTRNFTSASRWPHVEMPITSPSRFTTGPPELPCWTSPRTDVISL